MPDSQNLDPENRRLYGEILRPPAGYHFDCGVTTTYSLDFETALVIPAILAFHAAETRDDTLEIPLALLEGLERSAGRLVMFCDAGRIHGTTAGVNRLTALLEETVVEVKAPGGGAFHPKLWLLRFTSEAGRPVRLRLALLSRNLTRDVSWDISLCLDGEPGEGEQAGNEPLVTLLSALPELAHGQTVSARSRDIIKILAKDLARARWDPPAGLEKVSFAVNGLDEKTWIPRIGRTLGVISPFCDVSTLLRLTRGIEPERAHLLSRSEELDCLPREVLEHFGTVSVLDEMAEVADDDDDPNEGFADVPARGLHAKAFITERYATTEITVGSGNATSPALLTGKNVEVFATLFGPTRLIGSMDEQFAADRLGRFLCAYRPQERSEDTASQDAEKRLEAARAALVDADLRLRCEILDTGDASLRLRSSDRPAIPSGVHVDIWPLVLGESRAIPIEAGRLRRGVSLGNLALRDVTRWLGIRVCDDATDQRLLFSIGAEIRGLPESRNTELFRSIINNREAFLRYLRLLLSDLQDLSSALFERGSPGAWPDIPATLGDAPILEDMVRALIGEGEQLQDIARLMDRLGSQVNEDGASIVPPEFMPLWEAFDAVRPKRRQRSSG